MSYPWRNIMVATDFSEGSERALLQARDLAERLGCGLDLVHVVHPRALKGEVDRVLLEVEELERLRTGANARTPVNTHLRWGDTVPALVQAIEELQPSLVMIGSHGHTSGLRALLGSVAEKLCQRSPAPLMVIPAPERTSAKAKVAEHQEQAVGKAVVEPAEQAWVGEALALFSTAPPGASGYDVNPELRLRF